MSKCGGIICQGVEGAYSSIAGRLYDREAHITFKVGFSNVFDEVKGDNVGIVPIENSTAGEVGEVQDLLLRYDLYIIDSVTVKIEHCLLGLGEEGDIKTVYSHPQAIMQCSRYISSKNIEAIACGNTAVAAQNVKELNDKSVGAIGSFANVELYGLKPLKENISNYNDNLTKFVVLSDRFTIKKNAKTLSVIIAIDNKEGSLYKVIKLIHDYKVNMTKIQSRPFPGNNWQYVFHIDLEGNLNDKNINALVTELESTVNLLKILGNY